MVKHIGTHKTNMFYPNAYTGQILLYQGLDKASVSHFNPIYQTRNSGISVTCTSAVRPVGVFAKFRIYKMSIQVSPNTGADTGSYWSDNTKLYCLVLYTCWAKTFKVAYRHSPLVYFQPDTASMHLWRDGTYQGNLAN